MPNLILSFSSFCGISACVRFGEFNFKRKIEYLIVDFCDSMNLSCELFFQTGKGREKYLWIISNFCFCIQTDRTKSKDEYG